MNGQINNVTPCAPFYLSHLVLAPAVCKEEVVVLLVETVALRALFWWGSPPKCWLRILDVQMGCIVKGEAQKSPLYYWDCCAKQIQAQPKSLQTRLFTKEVFRSNEFCDYYKNTLHVTA